MPITNLNNHHLTEVEVNEINTALASLENALASITTNLTPEERQKYGSVNEQNKLVVNKVFDYYTNQPNLASQEVDWSEFIKDFESRKKMETILSRLNTLVNKLSNAKILHDFDNYQAALEDYAYTTYKAGSSAVGFETKRNDIKQFFTSRGNSTASTTPPNE